MTVIYVLVFALGSVVEKFLHPLKNKLLIFKVPELLALAAIRRVLLDVFY